MNLNFPWRCCTQSEMTLQDILGYQCSPHQWIISALWFYLYSRWLISCLNSLVCNTKGRLSSLKSHDRTLWSVTQRILWYNAVKPQTYKSRTLIKPWIKHVKMRHHLRFSLDFSLFNLLWRCRMMGKVYYLEHRRGEKVSARSYWKGPDYVFSFPQEQQVFAFPLLA